MEMQQIVAVYIESVKVLFAAAAELDSATPSPIFSKLFNAKDYLEKQAGHQLCALLAESGIPTYPS